MSPQEAFKIGFEKRASELYKEAKPSAEEIEKAKASHIGSTLGSFGFGLPAALIHGIKKDIGNKGKKYKDEEGVVKGLPSYTASRALHSLYAPLGGILGTVAGATIKGDSPEYMLPLALAGSVGGHMLGATQATSKYNKKVDRMV